VYQSTAPRNSIEQKMGHIASEASQPSYVQERISYGVITEVNTDTSQVKVTLLLDDGSTGEQVGNGYLPLIQPLDVVYLNFGSLRNGLRVRVYWRGRQYPPQAGLVEVVGDENYNFLAKEPQTPEVEIGPFKIFSSGF
jgi:hypothetical protein